jgi:hypothetical protein
MNRRNKVWDFSIYIYNPNMVKGVIPGKAGSYEKIQ